MKKILLALASLALVSTAQANDKSNLSEKLVSKGMQKSVAHIGANKSADDRVADACVAYTSTYELEALCFSIRPRPHITKACYDYTSTYELEGICLRQQPSPAVAEACFHYTYTYENEAVCLRRQPRPSAIEACYNGTSTVEAERACLRRRGRR